MHPRTWILGWLALFSLQARLHAASLPDPDAKVWDESGLAGWALPAAGNLPPHHISPEEYYAGLKDNLRTYPVYHPDREPKGYQDWLRSLSPQPLVDRTRLKTRKDWVQAGRRAFQELDAPLLRTADPNVLAYVRDRERLKRDGVPVLKDGSLPLLRWSVERPGELKLSVSECAACHVRILPDGSVLDGAPQNFSLLNEGAGRIFAAFNEKMGEPGRPHTSQEDHRIISRVPWLDDDIHQRFAGMSQDQLDRLDALVIPGTFVRFGGSPYWITRIPDLIGIQDRRYLDATATHLNRGPEDIARYAAHVTVADVGRFGPYEVITDHQRKVFLSRHHADEVLLAIGHYLYSLKPPRNPNRLDTLARRGREVFGEEGCAKCHDPRQGYTNNRLTPADGFVVPENHPEREHILARSVHTDPGLAMRTRKATGFYKVPSLRGLWYRDLLEHSGSIASLEDWFDPRRLRDDYTPLGWKGPFGPQRAVKGHEFGLDLPEADKKALIAFLRTL